jgi:hypothetical protein
LRHEDDEPVTWGDLRRIYKKLDTRISEAYEAIAAGDQIQSDFWDEHEEKLNRLLRRMNRHEKSDDAHSPT